MFGALRGVFGLIVLFLGCASAYSQTYHIKNFTVQHGLAQSGIYAMHQDARGKLWIGTEGGGLSVYNGLSFTTISTEQGLSGNVVRDIYEAPDGDIWIGTMDGGITYFDGIGYRFYNEKNGLKTNHVRAIAGDTLGNIWVGTYGKGLAKIGDGEVSHLTTAIGLPHDIVRDVVVSRDNRVIAGTDNGLAILSGHELKVFNTENGLPDNKIISLYEDGEGTIWIGTDHGVALLKGDSIEVPEWNERLEHPRVKAILVDHDGYTWLGTRKGLVKLKGDFYQKITTDNGLINNRIRCLTTDHSGSVWVGTHFGGLSQLYDQSFTKYTEDDHLASNYVSSVCADDTMLWIGTLEANTFGVSTNGSLQTHELPISSILSYKITGNTHWVGTQHDGLYAVVDGKIVNHIHGRNGLVSDQVNDIYIENENRIWIATSRGLGRITRHGGQSYAEHFVLDHSLQGNHATSLDANETGLYIGTEHGLKKIPVDELSKLNPRIVRIKKLTGVMVNVVKCDDFGNVWTGTAKSGLFRYNNDGLINYRKDLGFCSNMITQILPFDSTTMWVGTNKCLTKVTMDFDFEPLSVHNYGTNDGLFEIETTRNSMVRFGDKLAFGTYNGLVIYNPQKERDIAAAPILTIQGITLNGKRVDWNQWTDEIEPFTGNPSHLTLKHDENHLVFEFSGISLIQPKKVRYMHFLEGEDTEWSTITDHNYIPYPKLDHGTYTFKVLSSNADGVWNTTPITFTFEIKPAVWETWPFRIAAVILAVLLVYMVVRLRINQLQKEKERLEDVINERTKELRKEKAKSDELLLNILPASTATELKDQGFARTRDYDSATVLFTDFVGFTTMAENIPAKQMVRYLNECFKAFDDIMVKYSLEKIKTIGDAYMCAGGIPDESDDHAIRMTRAGLEMIAYMDRFNKRVLDKDYDPWKIRVGIHTGPLVAGVVGKKKFAYDIWGDSVNLAARMESSGSPNRLNVSEATHELIRDHFDCTSRGAIPAKNKGEIQMFFVDAPKPGKF